MKSKQLYLFLIVILFFCGSKLDAQNIPIVAMHGAKDNPIFVFILSDDLGWKDFETNLSAEFTNNGFALAGVNSNLYFKKRKTPQECAKDFSLVVRQYLADWNKGQIVLIGNRFGADVMPFIYNHLDEDIKNKVVKMFLIQPSASSDFETNVRDKIGSNNKNYAYNVPYEIKKIKSFPITCFWGEKETAFYNEKNKPSNVTLNIFKTGNHYTDYKTLVNLSRNEQSLK